MSAPESITISRQGKPARTTTPPQDVIGACDGKLKVTSRGQTAEKLAGPISPCFWKNLTDLEKPARQKRRARSARFCFSSAHLQCPSLFPPTGLTRRVTTGTLILTAFLVISTPLFLQESRGQSSLTRLESAGPQTRTAVRQPWWQFKPWSNSPKMPARQTTRPHPAVVRIIAPEDNATSYGTGTLIDVRSQYGLVITNWHVVCDATGPVEVCFPDGFRSQARALKFDPAWDLAALVVWRPKAVPVSIADQPPRPGDALTIHGYGHGQYRVAHGRCTQYYAPSPNYPEEMVELTVEARQGDSGGPILNQHGELAGVLFGAGQGTTIGSFSRRVESFLATLAPDIGEPHSETLLADAARDAPDVSLPNRSSTALNAAHIESPSQEKPSAHPTWNAQTPDNPNLGSTWPASETATLAASSAWRHSTTGAAGRAIANTTSEPPIQTVAPKAAPTHALDRIQSFLAVIGLFAICILIVRAVA